MIALYNAVFYEPIFNALIALYNWLPGTDLGLAIVALTVLIRILLYPLSLKSIHAQKMMQDLQPKMQEIKEKYKDNKEKQAEATMQLYKEENVNPLSSCLPLLLQLPFLIALFHALQNVADPSSLDVLYPFVVNPGSIESIGLFGLLDLSKSNILIALLAGAAQFWQGSMLMRRRPAVKTEGSKDEDFSALVNQQMTYIMPVVTVIIAWRFASGLGLYWFLSTLILAMQQWWHFHRKPSPPSSPTPALISGEQGK